MTSEAMQSVLQTVGILIFDEVEVLDFCGPFEVFASASATGDGDRDGRRLFNVITIAEEQRTIRCRGGLLVQPHHTFTDHPPIDILVVPGGFGTRREITNPAILNWIAAQDATTSLTTSVCTGAYLLAATIILDGKRATTHWAGVDWMRDNYPAVNVLDDLRVVDEGHIVTSAGVSAGIDMSLHIVGRLHGQAVAEETARGMEYESTGWRL